MCLSDQREAGLHSFHLLHEGCVVVSGQVQERERERVLQMFADTEWHQGSCHERDEPEKCSQNQKRDDAFVCARQLAE